MKGEMAKTIIKRRYELPVEKKAKDILRLNSAKNSCFQTEEALSAMLAGFRLPCGIFMINLPGRAVKTQNLTEMINIRRGKEV
jgi:hypothetical protein